MPQRRSKLQPPLGGLSRNLANADQPAGTSDELTNVRGIDPVTGRIRLSQRAGQTKLVDEQVVDGKVDELQSVAYDVPRVTYAQVLENHGIEWSERAGPRDEVLDVQTDRQGNVYCLTPDGTVTRFNSAGEEVDSFRPPVPVVSGVAYTVVPRLVVDEFDYVYVAATFSDTVTPAYGHQVWQYAVEEAPDGSDQWGQRWVIGEEPTANGAAITDFDVRVGQLALLVEEFGGSAGWEIRLYFKVYTGLPLLAWTNSEEVPDNCNRLRISSKGDVFLVFEPDATRGSSGYGAGYTASQIDWWFHSEFASENRLQALAVPDLMQSFSDGQRVTQVPDHRWAATNATPADLNGQPPGFLPDSEDAYENIPNDTAPTRILENESADDVDNGDGLTLLREPVWRSSGIGTLASLEFDRTEAARFTYTGGLGSAVTGNVLYSTAALSAFKSDADGDGITDSSGTNVSAISVVPNWDPSVTATGSDPLGGNGFVFCQAFELPAPSTTPMVIVTSAEPAGSGSYAKWALVYNVNAAGAATAGNLTFFYEDGTTSYTGITMPRTGANSWDPDDTASDRSNNPFIVFTMTHGGIQANSSPSRANESSVRINGRHMGRFTWNDQITGARFQWGSVFARNYDYQLDALWTPWADIANISNVEGFSGQAGLYSLMLMPDESFANDRPSVNSDIASGWGDVQPAGSTSNLPPAATGDNSGTADVSTYGTTRAAQIAYTQSVTTVERMEGCIAHYYGSSDVLPDPGSPAQDGESLWDAHPFGDTRVPVGENYGFIGNAQSVARVIDSSRGGLVKYSGANGLGVWGLNGAGIGYGVTTDDLDNPMTVGPTEEGKSVRVRRVIDNGSEYTTSTSEGGWAVDGPAQTYEYPILRTDTSGNLYWPVTLDTATDPDVVQSTHTVRRHDRDDGFLKYTLELPSTDQRIAAVDLPRGPLPLYLDDTITGPEFLYAASNDAGDADLSTIHKYRVVSQTQAVAQGQSLRRHDLIVVGGGDIKRISDGVVETSTNGSGAVLSSPYVQAVQLFGEVFITDGEKIVVVNPRTNEVMDYAPADGGEAPERVRILTAWRGRLIFARAADFPYEITASALGDPYNLNIYPAVPSVTSAFRVTAAGVGRAPDIVNAFIPLTDDLALLGGDHSLHVITGDPAAGGSVDVISDQVGAAFGNAWTKGPQGECYVFTSRGGVIVVPPGGNGFQRLSLQRIERTLQDVDLTLFKMRLVWDYRREGLIVCPVPWERTGEKHKGWFWEQKTGSWWEDEWDSTDLQPSALTIFDGDNPDDRRVLLGGEDGYVRYIDELASSDDGTRIRSKALIGPLVPGGESYDFRFLRPQITLASDQGGASYEFLGSNTADEPGEWWAKGELRPGRSEFIPSRTRGAAVWLRILNERVDERWSLEDVTVAVAPAGRSRAR